MDRFNFISFEEAVAKFEGQPLLNIVKHRNALLEQMQQMRTASGVVSLSEYAKFHRAKKILDEVLIRRGNKAK